MRFDLRSAAFVACVLLSYGTPTSWSACADEPPPAARNIRFVLEDEPFVDKMPDDYRPQEDLRYAAVVRGFAPLLLSEVQEPGKLPELRPLDAEGFATIASLDSSREGARMPKWMEKAALHTFKSSLIDEYDSELAPTPGPHVRVKGGLPRAVQSLSRNARFRDQFTPAKSTPHSPLQEYVLLAPSVEEAKQSAEFFLHVVDAGFVPWVRKLIAAEKAALEKSRDEAQAKLAEFDKKIAAASHEVEGVEELGQEAISDLKVKRTLLKVELAGVKARISSIEEKLKDLRPNLSANQQLNDKLVDLKVSADIDLASLAAEQKVLNELIDGQRRLAEIAHLRHQRQPYANQIQSAEQGLPRCDEILADLKPFQLVGDTVVIRPLRFRAE